MFLHIPLSYLAFQRFLAYHDVKKHTQHSHADMHTQDSGRCKGFDARVRFGSQEPEIVQTADQVETERFPGSASCGSFKETSEEVQLRRSKLRSSN